MISLMRAEWLKIRTNRWVSFLTLGLLPILVLILLNILAILGALNLWQPDIDAINWQEQIILALLFANQLVSQALFIIYAAISIGGDYRWNTWKNLIPRANRTQLILSKCLTLMIAIVVIIHAIAIMTFIGSWEITIALDVPLIGGVWDAVPISFEQRYLWLAVAIFFNYLIASLYAMISTIITRSTLAGIVIGVLIAFGDLLLQQAVNLLTAISGITALSQFIRLLPNYNVQNMMQWVISGASFEGWSLGLSFILLVGWVTIGVGISTILFRRQDIN